MFLGNLPRLSIGAPVAGLNFVMNPLISRLQCKAVAILFFGMACGQAFADGELKNGDFVETMRMKDNPDEQLLPKHWFASEPETTGNPWVKVFEADKAGVEIHAGDTSRFLFQDVPLDGTESWTLKWKWSGEGSATVSVVPRDDDGNIFEGVTETVELSDSPEEHEMVISGPTTTKIIRIMLTPGPNSIVTFRDMQLTYSD